jgi:ABC-2 type transport system permease protein
MISPSIFYVITTAIFGDPDFGPIIGGYVGTIFLCAGFTAVGVFASAVTKNQIIAFFTGFIICISLTMIDTFLVFLPSSIVEFVSYISADMHFTSITQGIIDSRDLVYFITLFALFFTATIKVQQNAKK